MVGSVLSKPFFAALAPDTLTWSLAIGMPLAAAGLFCLLRLRRRRSETRRYEWAVEASKDGIWDWSVPGGDCWTNERWSTMLGYGPRELGPITYDVWVDLLHPADRARVLAALEDHLEGRNERYEVEARLRCKDGSYRWLLLAGKVVERDGAGRPLRMVGTHKDIHDRRALQEELEREHRLFTGGPVVVFRWRSDPDWPVAYVSPNAAQLFGVDPEDFTSGRVLYKDVIHPDDRKRIADEVAAHSASGVLHFEQDYRIVRPDGEVRWVYDFTTIDRDEAGRAVHFDGYVLDVTARRRAELERKRLEAQVLQSQKLESLGILAGGIAHDFNNLLTGILGNLELLREDCASQGRGLDLVERIEAAAEQAASLSRQMLAYSGRGTFRLEPVRLEDVVGDLLPLLSSDLTRRLEFDPPAPPSPAVLADRSQVHQVVMNLVLNAAEATEQGGKVWLAIRRETVGERPASGRFVGDAPPPGEYVVLEVRDDGVGLDEEDFERIFDPFFTTKFTGRGLGLAVVLGILKAHGAHVHVDGCKGKGTVFRTYWPPCREESAGGEPEGPRASAEIAGADFLAGRRILVIEDEAGVRELARAALERCGATVRTAANGREGLEVFEREGGAFDLVVLDLTMPVMDGETCFWRLRGRRADLPVLLMTGFSEQEIERRFQGRSELHSAFLIKPFRTAALRAAVARLLTGVPNP